MATQKLQEAKIQILYLAPSLKAELQKLAKRRKIPLHDLILDLLQESMKCPPNSKKHSSDA